MHRRLVSEMSDDELDQLLEAKRARRDAVIQEQQATRAARSRVSSLTGGKKIDHQLHMLTKEVEALDKALDKVDKRVLNIRALRIQYEDQL